MKKLITVLFVAFAAVSCDDDLDLETAPCGANGFDYPVAVRCVDGTENGDVTYDCANNGGVATLLCAKAAKSARGRNFGN